MTELSPLSVILLAALGGGIFAVWRFMVKESRDSTTATNNNTSAMNQVNKTMEKSVEVMEKNTQLMETFKDEVASNIRKAMKTKTRTK